MPRRNDINSILIIGSGPIVIGQACEFDYSGTQACKVLRADGFRIILLNSNPATIMTDPEFADATYIEPINVDVLEKILQKEKPDAVLPTLGGQTALNLAYEAMNKNLFEKYNVKVLGVNYESLNKAEDRELFAKAMTKIGLKMPDASYVSTLDEAMAFLEKQRFPLVVRPYYTLGGSGGSVIYNFDEFKTKVQQGIHESFVGKVLVEKSVIGWKEFELEVMRDFRDNVVIICSIENVDPMGVHTGDSITVAPAQTLTDRQYQEMRDAAIKIIREIGVETGGSNVQFAVNPENGELNVIEMNPRVSRSSALASKATGFPIAKIAAKLAVGYTLDEIPNDITRETPASFEPAIDYCVIKIPRFAFEKFQGADTTLTTAMHSVGETMAIGRTFKEALQKGLRGLEIGASGLFHKKIENLNLSIDEIKAKLSAPNAERVFYIKKAMQNNISDSEINKLTGIDPWFLANMREIHECEKKLKKCNKFFGPGKDALSLAKAMGFSDRTLADIFNKSEMQIRNLRIKKNIIPVYKLVDTCAAEFESFTPYFYSTYETEDEIRCRNSKKVVILGGGPNRIGQGIEFDYCCVHASMALQEIGYDSIMINSNPETVSTDYDTSTKLFFEPLTFEDVMNIVEKENPLGVIVQLGGQTPLNIALPLYRAGVKILGTSPRSIDIVEDREKFRKFVNRHKFRQPESGSAVTEKGALKLAEKIGYPVMVRPSYVLGGRAMQIIYNSADLKKYIHEAIELNPDNPVLIDAYLKAAIEIDVDAVCDGQECVIAGIMEHIEEAGIHSGDSACSLPPFSLSEQLINEIKDWTRRIALLLEVKGLINIQFAAADSLLYILEVNPRASRTVPFVSKATGVPWAKIAAKIMCGLTLAEMKVRELSMPRYFSIKEAVIPFNKFAGADVVLGPEMRSTGEVMGIDFDFGKAFIKSQLAAGQKIPAEGNIFISVNEYDKKLVLPVAQKLYGLGYKIYATRGTAALLEKNNIAVTWLKKIREGSLNALDLLGENKIHLIINTLSHDKNTLDDEKKMRRRAIQLGVPIVTTIQAAIALSTGLEHYLAGDLTVNSLQNWNAELRISK